MLGLVRILPVAIGIFFATASARAQPLPIGPGSGMPIGATSVVVGGTVAPSHVFLLLSTHAFLLLANGTSRLCLIGGCSAPPPPCPNTMDFSVGCNSEYIFVITEPFQ